MGDIGASVNGTDRSAALAHGGQHIRRLPGGGGVQIPPNQATVFEKKCLSFREPQKTRHVKRLGKTSVGIGKQLEGQSLGFTKSPQDWRTVGADPEHGDSVVEQFGVGVSKAACLRGATGSARLRIEINERPAVREVPQVNLLAQFIGSGKIRQRRARRKGVGFRKKPSAEAGKRRANAHATTRAREVGKIKRRGANFPMDKSADGPYRKRPRRPSPEATWQSSSGVEQRTHKPLVGGSNPPSATTRFFSSSRARNGEMDGDATCKGEIFTPKKNACPRRSRRWKGIPING